MALNRVSTGSYDLNKWLFGGYEKGVISMIVGPPGSGKTNFAILTACSQAKKGNKVLFMDTEGGFSVERVKQIVGEGYKDILKNIIILEATCFEEQKKNLEKLVNKIKNKDVSMIVVDGMAMLYRLELGDAVKSGEDFNIKQVNREMAKQMRVLAEIARKENLPVIITNQVYGSFLTDEEIKKGAERVMNIVGGDLLKYWSKCIIELKVDKGRRRAVLLKHRCLGNKSLIFEIRNEGIFKKGWI